GLVLIGRCRALLLAAAVFMSPRLAAQTSTGAIRGHISDNTNAPIAGAEIVAVDLSTNTQRSATADTKGFYALNGLRPSNYQLTVRHIGNAPVQRSIQVQVGQTLTLDYQLAPATVQLQEVVATAAPVQETRTSEVATNITQAQIEKLPTASRNFLDLANLAPGITVSEDRISGN